MAMLQHARVVPHRMCTPFLPKRHAQRLVYAEYGEPAAVLRLAQYQPAARLEPRQVRLAWRAAPVNPADVNQLQGVYPVKPPLPATPGNEGCAWVKEVGSAVESLRPGDLVVPAQSGAGTWCTESVLAEHEVFPLNPKLDRKVAAMFQVNPPTAYRMLHDFVQLRPGDLVVQNGANSAVGRFVIQLCKALGWKSVNVVRDRPEIDGLKNELKSIGADLVLTEDEFYKSRDVKNVRLALNCVGGRSSMFLARSLGQGGCMVTYGGMSKQPVQSPTAPLIFKDISLRGFWMSHWYTVAANTDQRRRMYEQLADLFMSGALTAVPSQEHPLADFKEALAQGLDAKHKHIFVMDQ